MIKRLLVAALAVVLLVVGAGIVYVFYRPGVGEPVEVDIGAGATTQEIGVALADEGVIESIFAFRVMAKLRGLDGDIQAGRYLMNRGMGVQAALDVLSRTPEEKGASVTVPEGFTLRQIAARIGARTKISDVEFTTHATGGSIRADIQPPGVNTLEGFLFPETYFIADTEKAADAVRRMVRTFEDATNDVDWSHPESRGLSRYQAVIVASLVEREARVPEDRAKIAAVIYNRLAKGMRLQIDATAIYGLEEHKVPTRADLRRPSPHNTYLIDGLPPTPIANPGAEAIDAALHPASSGDLYYVVCEPSGKHCFTDSLEEFQRLQDRRPAEVRG